MPLPPRKNAPKIATSLIGNAGVHFVCMELSLRGLIAIPTTRNTAGIDVLASTPDGAHTASIQVKTSQTKVGFWPTPQATAITDSEGVWFVFLRWITAETRFEAFIASASLVKSHVQAHTDAVAARGGNTSFPVWNLPKGDAAEALRDAWRIWSPDGVPRARLI